MISLNLVLLTTLITPAAEAASRIYRVVDEHGNVVFTDVPPADEKDAREVQLGVSNTFDAESSPPPPGSRREQPAQGDGTQVLAYHSALIVTPEHDAGVRENSGNVTVTSRVEPALQQGHRVRLMLDNTDQGLSTSGTFRLTNLTRGTHVVRIEVLDADNRVLFMGEESTFHLLRI